MSDRRRRGADIVPALPCRYLVCACKAEKSGQMPNITERETHWCCSKCHCFFTGRKIKHHWGYGWKGGGLGHRPSTKVRDSRTPREDDNAVSARGFWRTTNDIYGHRVIPAAPTRRSQPLTRNRYAPRTAGTESQLLLSWPSPNAPYHSLSKTIDG